MLPGAAAVAGFVNAIAGGKIGAAQAFAAAYIDDVGVARGYGQRADGAGGLPVEDRGPGAAGVGGFPDTAVIYADVKKIWFAGDAGGGHRAATAKRSDAAPLQVGVEAGGELRDIYICVGGGGRLRRGGGRQRERC